MKNSYNTGIASEYLILSMLYRLDIDAFMSLGNKKKVDLIINIGCGLNYTIDVKSVRGYSSLILNNIKESQNHFIVFVIYNNKYGDLISLPDIFIVPSIEIKLFVKNYNNQLRVMKTDILKYKNAWFYFT